MIHFGLPGVGCLSLRTFYLRAGITSDVSATPHLHGGPVHIFSTRTVDFDDSFCLSLSSFTVVSSPSLLPVLAACFFSLSFLVLPLVSFTFLLGFVWSQCVGESFKG